MVACAPSWYQRTVPEHTSSPTRRTLAVALATMLLAAWCTSVGAGGWSLGGMDPGPEPEPALVAALHDQVDAARSAAGLPRLAWDDGLARAARAHAAELAARGVLDHAGARPENRTLIDRLQRAGVPYANVGENLAFERGVPDPVATVVDGWLRSPPHRANLLNPSFDRVGYGSARDAAGGRTVVQVFAAARWVPERTALAVETVVGYRVRVDVVVSTSSAVAGLLELGGVAERVTWTPGTLRLERTLAALPTTLRLAVDIGRPAYSVDEVGAVDGLGAWRPDAVAARRWLRVANVATTVEVEERLHVRFEVDPSIGAVLLVDGHHRPEASAAPGLLVASLPLADGGSVALALAEPLADGRLLIRHAFVARRHGGAAVLAAGR
jgi:uncharacterized protein YkwD